MLFLTPAPPEHGLGVHHSVGVCNLPDGFLPEALLHFQPELQDRPGGPPSSMTARYCSVAPSGSSLRLDTARRCLAGVSPGVLRAVFLAAQFLSMPVLYADASPDHCRPAGRSGSCRPRSFPAQSARSFLLSRPRRLFLGIPPRTWRLSGTAPGRRAPSSRPRPRARARRTSGPAGPPCCRRC